jgi:hypothetical protein
METARVRLADKTAAPAALYALGRVAGELADWPARLLGRGHGMVAYLRSEAA